jgi:hypothetical protein
MRIAIENTHGRFLRGGVIGYFHFENAIWNTRTGKYDVSIDRKHLNIARSEISKKVKNNTNEYFKVNFGFEEENYF